MQNHETGQVTKSAAEMYEERFVPALFAEWAPRTLDAAGVASGHRVLDVACGTGVVARTAAPRVAPNGSVAGLDLNPGMLAVARRKDPHVEWREGRAESLPFDDAQFDAVACQFGLMFFEDRVRALQEMRRVARPGARIVATVWDELSRAPAEAALTQLLEQNGAAAAAEALRAPFNLGDVERVRRLFVDAGMGSARVQTVVGTARYDSIESFVETSVKGWTFASDVDDRQYGRLLDGAKERLAPYIDRKGRLNMPAPAHVVVAQR